MSRGFASLACGLTLVAAGCGSPGEADPAPPPSPGTTAAAEELVGSRGEVFPEAPAIPEGPLAAEVEADLDLIIGDLPAAIPVDAIGRLGRSGDARLGWFLSDLLRFVGGATAAQITAAFEELTGTEITGVPWLDVTNHLIAWDTPAPPGYRERKGSVFGIVEPKWEPFFDDADADIDWRLVSWGGVFIDDRVDATTGAPCSRGCIPALDDPAVTDATGGDWYPDERAVFGVVIDGEARAYPKNIMEVHEMVNDTLGGRRIALPYCTLCGSAQVYFADNVEGFAPVLRTSGLLSRSNKVMYDITTHSVLDTFTGRALSGPLQDAGVALEQGSVVTSTWGDWKVAHPDTTIVAEDGGLGRRYPLDPLGGRDDDGPIFPVGDVDPRLPVQELVLGVIAPDETPVAFPVGAALLALQAGEDVELAGVRVELDGGGLRAFIDGTDAAGHEAFWFAWSQFQPGTLVWERG